MSVTLLVPESGTKNEATFEGWTVIEGEPTMTTWFEYYAPDKSVVAGTWKATPGTYHSVSRYLEFVTMIEGRIEITPDGGETVSVGPGDSYVVAADFVGTWKILEPVRKRFLIKLA